MAHFGGWSRHLCFIIIYYYFRPKELNPRHLQSGFGARRADRPPSSQCCHLRTGSRRRQGSFLVNFQILLICVKNHLNQPKQKV